MQISRSSIRIARRSASSASLTRRRSSAVGCAGGVGGASSSAGSTLGASAIFSGRATGARMSSRNRAATASRAVGVGGESATWSCGKSSANWPRTSAHNSPRAESVVPRRRRGIAAGSCESWSASVAKRWRSAHVSHVSADGRSTTDGVVRRASARMVAHDSWGERDPSAASATRSRVYTWQCSSACIAAIASGVWPLARGPWTSRRGRHSEGYATPPTSDVNDAPPPRKAEGGAAPSAIGGKISASFVRIVSRVGWRSGARCAGSGADGSETARWAAGVIAAIAATKCARATLTALASIRYFSSVAKTCATTTGVLRRAAK